MCFLDSGFRRNDGRDSVQLRNSYIIQSCFNTCLRRRIGHFVYSLMLHEAGHALGFSGYSLPDLPTGGYEMAHAIAADTVMNYDYEAPQNHDPMGNRVRAEPDCAPHPLDLLAIHALYQTVDR